MISAVGIPLMFGNVKDVTENNLIILLDKSRIICYFLIRIKK